MVRHRDNDWRFLETLATPHLLCCTGNLSPLPFQHTHSCMRGCSCQLLMLNPSARRTAQALARLAVCSPLQCPLGLVIERGTTYHGSCSASFTRIPRCRCGSHHRPLLTCLRLGFFSASCVYCPSMTSQDQQVQSQQLPMFAWCTRACPTCICLPACLATCPPAYAPAYHCSDHLTNRPWNALHSKLYRMCPVNQQECCGRAPKAL